MLRIIILCGPVSENNVRARALQKLIFRIQFLTFLMNQLLDCYLFFFNWKSNQMKKT